MYTQVYAHRETQERLAEGHAIARYSSFIPGLSQLTFADADDRRAFPPTVHRVLARQGLFRLTAPGEHGGLALSLQEAIDLISATASLAASISLSVTS
ncbi:MULTISPECIES: acyl-CoA dehydrogenase family protein [unclassified Bradyrhizobium]